MRISLNRDGLYVLFRAGTLDRKRQPIGFVVKPAKWMLFGERHGLWRGIKIGPLYVRTYQAKGENQ